MSSKIDGKKKKNPGSSIFKENYKRNAEVEIALNNRSLWNESPPGRRVTASALHYPPGKNCLVLFFLQPVIVQRDESREIMLSGWVGRGGRGGTFLSIQLHIYN